MMPETCTHFPVDRLIPRPIRPEEVPHIRRVWWRLASIGYQLPPERGVILFDGDRQWTR